MVFLVGGALLVMITALHILAKKLGLNKELSRKICHMVLGISAIFLPLFITYQQIVGIGLVFAVLMFFSKRKNIFSSVHSVERTTYGEVYFPLGIALAALAFPQYPAYAFGVSVMSVSDGLAGIIGQMVSSREFSMLGAKKSLAGSLTFFTAALLIGVFLFLIAGLTVSFAVAASLLTALVLTSVEAVLPYGTDNLFLPVISATLFSLLTSM